MFEKLFGKVSDVVHHKIAPYADERQPGLSRRSRAHGQFSADPRAALLLAQNSMKEIYEQKGQKGEAVAELRKILDGLDDPAVRTAVRFAIADIYKETGQRDRALEELRLVYHVKELEKRGLLRHVGERRKRNCVERLVQATALHYTIAPEALGALGLDPRRVRDRFSSAYLAALLTRAAREVASLQERAEQAGQRLATLTLETELRFASPATQQAFAEELTQAVKDLVARHYDERAPRGRRFRFVIGGYPATARERRPS